MSIPPVSGYTNSASITVASEACTNSSTIIVASDSSDAGTNFATITVGNLLSSDPTRSRARHLRPR